MILTIDEMETDTAEREKEAQMKADRRQTPKERRIH